MNERERIEYLIEAYGLTPSQFADRTGIPRASVSHILGGRNKPSLEILQKVAAVFPSVDLNWLMLGVGNAPAVSKDGAAELAGQQQQRESLFSESEDTVRYEQPVVPQVSRPRVEEQQPKQQRIIAPKQPSAERVQRKAQRPVEEAVATKKIKEIRVFYSDGTYEILYPEK